jgi:hypothetical protein
MSRSSAVFAITVLVSTAAFNAAAADSEPQLEPEPLARAGVAAEADVPEGSSASAARAARDGQIFAYTQGAAMPAGHADASGYAGYDSAAEAFRARSAAEAKVLSLLALRVEFEHGPASGVDSRLSLGARVAILKQSLHRLDLGAALYYQPKDFRDEGNVVGGLLVGRRFGRLGLFANAFIGSDPEGDDQSFEARIATQYSASPRWLLGIDGRVRYNASSDEKSVRARAVDWELQSGPTVALALGPLALMAMAGPSFLRSTAPHDAGVAAESSTRAGMLALAGVGGAL